MKCSYSRTLTILFLSLLPLGGWAEEVSSDDDFFGDDSPTVVEAPAAGGDPTKAFTESAEGVRWGGSVDSSAEWNGGWVGQKPSAADLTDGWKDALDYGLSTKLYVDARPDADFRFRLSLKTGYPFTTDTTVVNGVDYLHETTTTTTVSVPNIAVWEMFTDVTLDNTVFLRFGKQSASWGAAYFYSPGDVISLTAKDATDPTAEREGPVALKATVPFPGLKANLTGFILARDSYFNGDVPTLQTLGYALQADALVGDAQVSLGGFYQEDNAPKAVATLNTGFGFLDLPVLNDVNLFSEAVFSYGSDVLKGSGTIDLPGFGEGYASVTEWKKTVYYTGTLGASYSNDDANLTLRAEYLYNPFGSNDRKAAEKAYYTTFANTAGVYETLGGSNKADRDYGFGDASTPGMHNLTALASFSQVAGSDKLSFSTLWQQNLSDRSGWVKPSFSLSPWDVLTLTWGLSLVYGDEGTQYPLLFQSYSTDLVAQGTKWVTLNVGVTFGTGKY